MRDKNYTPKNTVSGLNARITAAAETLAAETDEVRKSEQFLTFMATCAKFHQYSINNMLLIMLQAPTASQVAGYTTWQKLNRHVKKGEEGIAILAPCKFQTTFTDEETGEKTKSNPIAFRVVYVFDYSQTEGADLPEPPTWKSPEQNEELKTRLLAYCETLNIQVLFEDTGDAEGSSHGGTIKIKPSAGTKTLVHEIAHELLHRATSEDRQLTREIKELEAEATAYIVCTTMGMPAESSPNYIALWDGDSKTLLSRMDRIRRAADAILNAVIPTPEPEE